MANKSKCPICDRTECAGCEDGHCVLLTDNDFYKPCPFFKTREQVAKEREYCQRRLAEMKKEETLCVTED